MPSSSSVDRITEVCKNCKNIVRMQCQKGTGYCSQTCQKNPKPGPQFAIAA